VTALARVLSYVDGKNKVVGVPAEFGVLTNRGVIDLLEGLDLTRVPR